MSAGHGYITAQSRVVPDGPTGYDFYHCRLIAKNPEVRTFLGRPWRPYSRVVYIDCWMGDQIRPSGWNNWGNPANKKTAWYAEYGSKGPGAKPQDRVSWVRKLTAAAVKQFLPDNFLRGSDSWQPASKSRK
ncbi:MAG: pectinesterase family protein [Acidobacteriota bacterium]